MHLHSLTGKSKRSLSPLWVLRDFKTAGLASQGDRNLYFFSKWGMQRSFAWLTRSRLLHSKTHQCLESNELNQSLIWEEQEHSVHLFKSVIQVSTGKKRDVCYSISSLSTIKSLSLEIYLPLIIRKSSQISDVGEKSSGQAQKSSLCPNSPIQTLMVDKCPGALST